MIKNVLPLLFLFFIMKAEAQIVVAEDFSLTDVWGIQRNLYSELDLGKTIVLNFFITNCGTCQVNSSKLDSIWQNYGYNGDSLWIWGIESSGKLDDEILEFMSQFNVSFPCFSTYNDDVVLYVYNITYAPQYFVICPNKIIKQVASTQIESAIYGCKSSKIEEVNENIIFWDNNKLIVQSDCHFNVQIYDVYGRKIKEVISAVYSADMGDLNSGVYFCSIKFKHRLFSKIIIKH